MQDSKKITASAESVTPQTETARKLLLPFRPIGELIAEVEAAERAQASDAAPAASAAQRERS